MDNSENNDRKIIYDNKGRKYEQVETGIDKDGNKVSVIQKRSAWVSPTKLMLGDGRITTMDPMEISYEAYNPNNFKIVFENQHYDPDDLLFNPKSITVGPKQFALIPHHYYAPWIEFIGNPVKDNISIIQNYGDQKFKQNTKISRPEVQKKLY